MKYRLIALGIITSLLVLPLDVSASAGGSAQQDVPLEGNLPGTLSFDQIASGLSSPVAITHAGDGSGRLFITLQGGQIVIYDGAQILPTPFLNISSKIASGGERGLLSTAFHPNYSGNGYFYVNYTRASDGATVIARYSVSSDPNTADTVETPILVISQPEPNHNGGQLQFGPDGYLYIGMGDGGGGGDPQNNAQDPDSLLGKILRIDVDSAFPYAVPANNPFVGDPLVRDEVWAFGLRNPWRFSFDRLTGAMFIADVGQNAWEEINFQPAGSSGGENYGWSCYEGTHTYSTTRNCTLYGSLTPPILEYNHGTNDSIGCSVTGGYIYRGNRHPGLAGAYLYGDFCTGNLWAARQDGSGWINGLILDTPYTISTFGEGEDGELYLASYGGTIYHITASSFSDVDPSDWAWSWIETLYANGVTGGCGVNPLRYCPTDAVTRDQMAVFLLKAEHGGSYAPPQADGIFNDVPVRHWAAGWIEQLYAENITDGCSVSPLEYCPAASLTRAQMAVFLLRGKHGAGYTPPPPGGIFSDVPADHWAADWIEQLYREGITAGCSVSPLRYCPDAPVLRDQMAVFLTRAFDLPSP